MKRFGLALLAFAALAALSISALAQPGPGPRGEGRQPGRFNPLLRLFDADQDGTLSQEEIEGAGAKLKALDRSGDGKVDPEELRGVMPFGLGGPGGPGRPGRGFGGRGPFGGTSQNDFGGPPLPKNDVEKKILTALDQMRQGPRFANVSPLDGRLLRLLAETTGAKRVVEIGTSTGESGVWLALGMRSTGGHLFTHEVDKRRAEIAQENFKKAGVDDLITIVLGDAHEMVKRYSKPGDDLFVDRAKGEAIDILFLDADKEGYIDYLDKLMPLIRPGGLIVAHNMNPRQADPRYLEAITTNPDLETSFLLMEGSGVGVTMKKR